MLAQQTFRVKPIRKKFVWRSNPTKSEMVYPAGMDQAAVALGKAFKVLREARQQTQAEVAEAVGIGRSTLTNIELGRDPPGRETLIALAAYYETRLDDLMAAMRQPTETPATTPTEFLELAVRFLGRDHGLDPALYSKRLSSIQKALQEAHQAGKKVTFEVVPGLLIDAIERPPDDPASQ